MTLPSIRSNVETLRARHLSRNKRREETAMGAEGAAVLLSRVLALAMELDRPVQVADLGSGFSSTALRWLGQNGTPLTVWSVDTEPRWLATTVAELEAEGLPLDFCLELAEFEAMNLEAHFDCLFVDIGPTSCRLDLARRGRLASWLAPDGVMLLDDWHMAHYREAMEPLLIEHGFTIRALPESTDQHGRYLAEARRS